MLASSDINGILSLIVELGYVQFAAGTIAQAIKPQFNVYVTPEESVYLDRWNSTIQYLHDYARYHPSFTGDYFLCLYDGWREMLEGVDESQRVYTDWYSYSSSEQHNSFSGVGTIGEPRFYSHLEPQIYVNLPLPVLAYSRHINDSNVLLIPDHEFLETEFKPQVRSVISGDIPWYEKQTQIMWRGAAHVNAGYSYLATGYEASLAAVGRSTIHPRDLACSISQSKGQLNPDIGQIVNASFEQTSIAEMLKYKYQLDLDGMVNAWSGLYWKLYSNSMVFKLHSHWEQWYYREMVPYVHFIPLIDLSPNVVQDAYAWCEDTNGPACEQIAVESGKFARTLTYEYAVKTYTIH